jgi:hypothetical protein
MGQYNSISTEKTIKFLADSVKYSQNEDVTLNVSDENGGD